jgi:phosphonate transport system permease protein
MSDALIPSLQWQRHSPMQRLLRYGIWLLMVSALVQAARTVEVIPEFLYDAPEQMVDMLQRMWPVDWSHYRGPGGVHEALMETLHMATLGTLLSLGLALPLGVMVAPNITRNRLLNFVARLLLVASRSVNSLVWALLFVAIFGPGPLAGMLAIALRSVGFVGKLIGEALEQASRGPIEALQATGASRFSLLWYGYWPQIKPAFWSVALLRWDINVRESGVLGLVGAGGIGVVLNTAIDLFHWNRVALVLVAIFAVVVVAELLVLQVRKRVL